MVATIGFARNLQIRSIRILWFLLLFCFVFNGCKKKTATVEETSIKTYKLFSYNKYKGFNGDAVKITWFKKMIYTMKPGAIALQEVKDFTKASLQTFAMRIGFIYALMVHVTVLPVALVSKYPITKIKNVISQLHLIDATILDYHFFVIHLSPLTCNVRKTEMEIILQRTRAISKRKKILMVGDFNNMLPQNASFYDKNTNKMALVRLLI